MTPISIIDLIAGLIFIYFLLAIINNSLFELLATAAKWRAKNLKLWLQTVLIGKINTHKAYDIFVNHPAISALSDRNKSTAYFAAKDFSMVLIELICSEHEDTPPDTLQNIKIALKKTTILPEELKRTFLYFLAKTEACKAVDNKIVEIQHFQKQIEDWFDSMMQRLTGTFKRRAMLITLIFATFITITLNIDTISLANYLYSNPEARQQLAMTAYNKASDDKTVALVDKIRNKAVVDDTVQMSLDSLRQEISTQKALIDTTMGTLNANIPMGWNKAERVSFSDNWVKKTGGWIITILAICLGAPFWFDILGKVANLRGSIKPLTTKEESAPPPAAAT